MYQRSLQLIAVIVLLHLTGAHWFALQSVAWIKMVRSFAITEHSISAAIEKTFDGEHPCDLCMTVKKGRAEEKQTDGASFQVKLEAVLQSTTVVMLPVGAPMEYQNVDDFGHSTTERPRVQPPRV